MRRTKKLKPWRDQFGKTFLGVVDEQVVLVVGKDSFTKRELIEKLGCGNFTAARKLSKAVKRLRPKSVRELASRTNFNTMLSLKGVGMTAFWVWMNALDHAGVNPVKWIDAKQKVPTLYEKTR